VPGADTDSSGDAPPGVAGGIESIEVGRACGVLHAAHLGNTVWGFVATRDDFGRGVWVTRDNLGFNETSVGDQVLVSLSGEVLEGRGETDAEYGMALAVMVARPDVHALVHAHSLHATSFGATHRQFHAISHEGCHLVPPDLARQRIAGESKSGDKGSEIATTLGTRNAVLLVGHGLVTAGASLGETVALAVYLERACQLQLLAEEHVHTVDDLDVMEKRFGQLQRPRISWEYLRRVTP